MYSYTRTLNHPHQISPAGPAIVLSSHLEDHRFKDPGLKSAASWHDHHEVVRRLAVTRAWIWELDDLHSL